MSVAMQDVEVARAFKLLQKDDWHSLYKVYEIVKKDMKGEQQISDRGWTTKNELERFRRTANSSQILGDQARHGIQKGDLPPDPMDILEARLTIHQLVKRWIDSKQPLTP